MPDYNLYDTLTPEEKQEADKLLQSAPTYDSFGSPAPRSYDIRPMSTKSYTIGGFSMGGAPMRFQHSAMDVERDKNRQMQMQDSIYNREQKMQEAAGVQSPEEKKSRFSFERGQKNEASQAAIRNVFGKKKMLSDILNADNFDSLVNSLLDRS